MNIVIPRSLTRCTLSHCSSKTICRQTPIPQAMRRAVANTCIIGNIHSTNIIIIQSRTQFAQVPGKRDQEAFLSQYDPLEVLGLEESCSVDEIDAAFKQKTAKYGPNGSTPDAKMVDRVFRAHEILKDPGSPYYLRAHSSESDRQRLQFQLLPKSKRQFIQVQVGILMILLMGIAMLVITLMFRPLKRSMRAATR